MRVTFWFVRHGRTLFNDLMRLQGWCDSPLDGEGTETAERAGSWLRRIHFDHVVSSSSQRAIDTAEIICRGRNLKAVPMKEFREFSYGDYDGLYISQAKDMFIMDDVRDDWSVSGGENMALFQKRVLEGFEKVLSFCRDGDTVLLVSHATFFYHFMRFALGVDTKSYLHACHAKGRSVVPNASCAVFAWEDGDFRLLQMPVLFDELRQQENKKVTFCCIASGETVFEARGRRQGWSDSPLTAKGIQQAERRRDAIQDMHFDRVVSSTAERARDTAEILCAGRDLPIETDRRLRDVFHGAEEGAGVLEIMQGDKGLSIRKESRMDVRHRLRSVFTELADDASDGDTILIVTHQDVYRHLLTALDIMTEAEVQNQPSAMTGELCAMGIFTYENGTYHLKRMMHEEEK